MNRFLSMFTLVASLCVLSVTSYTGDKDKNSPASGFRAEYLAQLDEVQQKIVSLAEAIPADTYAWRPAEGVRSVGEVFVHLAGANYFFPSLFGAKIPEGFSQETEKTVGGKSEVLEMLNKSFSSIRDVVLKQSEADLERKVDMFGKEVTVRGVLMAAANHIHEHMGQSIAYARTNGVVPPWSR